MNRVLRFFLIIVLLGIFHALPSGADGDRYIKGPPPLIGPWVKDGTGIKTRDGITHVAMGSPLLSVATATSLTAAQMKGYIVVLTGDGTVLTLADSDDTSTGSCIRVRIGDATAKSIDVSSDDADNFELNGVGMTASYAISIAAGNQGKEIRICDEGGTNEFIAKGDLEFTDSGAD